MLANLDFFRRSVIFSFLISAAPQATRADFDGARRGQYPLVEDLHRCEVGVQHRARVALHQTRRQGEYLNFDFLHYLLFENCAHCSREPADAPQKRYHYDLYKISESRPSPMSVGALIEAYWEGVFPWKVSEKGFPEWIIYGQRGVLDFSRMRIGSDARRNFRRAMRSYRVTRNQAFERVVNACRTVPRRDKSHWIDPKHVQAYTELHKRGLAHSIEVWKGTQLVGGVYGVFIGNVFSGESMFHTEDDTSKVAAYYLAAHLKAIGVKWIDMQMIVRGSPYDALDARRISLHEFRTLLDVSHADYLYQPRNFGDDSVIFEGIHGQPFDLDYLTRERKSTLPHVEEKSPTPLI